MTVVVCAWCPDVDARTRAARVDNVAVSHGMCPRCQERTEREPLGPVPARDLGLDELFDRR